MSAGEYLKAKEQDLKAPENEILAVEQALGDVERFFAQKDLPLAIAERYRAGSYPKRIMLKGRREADVVLALTEFPKADPLGTLQQAFQSYLPGVKATPKSKALELIFPSGASVDVLPIATPERTVNYRHVPTKFRSAIDGRSHTSWFIDNAHGTVIHPTVILLKGIRDAHASGGRLSSFGLELLAVDVLKGHRGGLESALHTVLHSLAENPARLRGLRDPALASNKPLEGMTHSELKAVQQTAKSLLSSLDKGQPSALFHRGTPRTSQNLGGRPLG